MSLAAKKKKIFDNRYEIIAIVGRGAASVVYHARHLSGSQSDVALKVLLGQKGDKTNAELLRKEALAMVSARHKYVVRLDDFHSVGDLSYLSMEYANESDLRKYMKKTANRLGPVQGQLFLIQIAEALNFVHQAGMIHRDIKPDNILVISDYEARLADFGVSVLPGETSSLTELQKGVGTMSYMAPEVLEGIGYDQRSDIYALGVTFYEVISGVHPFDNIPLLQQLEIRKDGAFPSIETLAPNIPAQLAKVIMKAMSYDPKDRFATARELVQTLLVQKTDTTAAEQKRPIAESAAAAPKTPAPDKVEVSEVKAQSAEPAPNKPTFRLREGGKPGAPTSSKVQQPAAAAAPSAQAPKAPANKPPAVPVQKEKLSAPRPGTPDTKQSGGSKQQGIHQVDRKAVPAREERKEDKKGSQESREVERMNVQETVIAPAFKTSPKLKRPDDQPQAAKPKVAPQAPARYASSDSNDERKKRLFLTSAIAVFFLILALVVRPEIAKYAIKGIKATLISSPTTEGISMIPQYDGSALQFPELPAGLYSGAIFGLGGQKQLPLSILSLPEQNRLVVIVGIEGWSPASAEPYSEESPDQGVLRVKSNGQILDLTGQSENGELKGSFRDVVSGDQGEWQLAPVTLQISPAKG